MAEAINKPKTLGDMLGLTQEPAATGTVCSRVSECKLKQLLGDKIVCTDKRALRESLDIFCDKP